MDSGGEDWLVARSNQANIIDLRPGTFSGAVESGEFLYASGIAYGTDIENASGSLSNDTMTGNHLKNQMLGLDGNDILRGGPGDDSLYGGSGNDEYQFDLGDDRDVINENGTGGSDVIKIFGFDDFDSLVDLSFRQLGSNDLLIRIQPGENASHTNDSIRIRHMGDERSRVETLKLYHGQTEFASISLPSVFAQSNDLVAKFEIGQGSDQFGSLVTRI